MNNEYFQLENKDYDIPFYRQNPKLTSGQLAALIISAVLTFAISFLDTTQLLKAILFLIVPTSTVYYALNGNMSEIFRMPERKDILYILIFLIIFFILSIMSNAVLKALAIPIPRHHPLTHLL